MPTKKKAAKKAAPKAKKVAKPAAKPVAKEQPKEAPAPEPKKLPKYGGKQVIEVLNDGKETADAYHCRMEDNTTQHVPKELFE